MKTTLTLLLIILMTFLSEGDTTTVQERQASLEQHFKLKEDSPFKNLQWRNIGPYYVGGRISDIEAYEKNPYKFLVATASGGLWLTRNNGTTWESLFDGESCIGLGDVAICQDNENLIWLGTGESSLYGNAFPGTGIFKSTNGGKTWKNMGLIDSHHIGRIRIHPGNENIVYVAALGHMYSKNSQRGVFKTVNGGETWEKVLFIDDGVGIIDLAMHAKNPQILYAAAYDFVKTPTRKRVQSGLKSAIYKTQDGGKTWKKSVKGFPQNKYVGRIGLAVTQANPNVVYAYLHNLEPIPMQKKDKRKNKSESGITMAMLKVMKKEEFLALDDDKLKLFFEEKKVPKQYTVAIVKIMMSEGRITMAFLVQSIEDLDNPYYDDKIKGVEIYKSTDNGESWKKTHKKYLDKVGKISGSGFGRLCVSPRDENVVFVFGEPLIKSVDGGKTFKNAAAAHDEGPNYRGDEVHVDQHAMWINPHNADHILLGNDGGVDISYDEGESWQAIQNLSISQCFAVNYDFQTPYRVYVGLQDNGTMSGPSNFKFAERRGAWKLLIWGDGVAVSPEPGNPDVVYGTNQFGNLYRLDGKTGESKLLTPKAINKKKKHRFHFLSPFIISQHNPFTFYLCCNKVLKSVDKGKNWYEISTDLSKKQHIQNGSHYGTVLSFAESPLSPEILYAGTDDGNIWVSRRGGVQWEDISAGLPKTRVNCITASKFKKERVYVTVSGAYENDYSTHVFVSNQWGRNWQSLKSNLPAAENVNVIREDPENENTLYLGTDLTAYVSFDRGKCWHSLKSNLPTNAVYDLQIHPREKELIIGTHGRGVYILPLENLKNKVN